MTTVAVARNNNERKIFSNMYNIEGGGSYKECNQREEGTVKGGTESAD